MRKKRHNYTPEEKVFILRRHLVDRGTACGTALTGIIRRLYISCMKTATLTISEQELFSAIPRANLDCRTVKKYLGARPLLEKEKP